MSIKKVLSASIAAGLFAVAHLASAATVTITVDARDNSVTGGVAANSHIRLDAGENFALSVDPTQTWNLSGGDPAYTYNANGNPGWTYGFTNPDGTVFNAALGSLIGQVGSGHYFTVGTDYSGRADTSGILKLYFADTDSFNNSGSVDAVFVLRPVSPVPEPSMAATTTLGLAAIGLLARARRRRK